MDFTYNICEQKFKLGVLSFAAYHFVGGIWRSTVIPVFYCLSGKENTAAYLPLIQATLEQFQTRFGVDLKTKIRTVFTDGAAAAKQALTLILPDVHQILLL